MSAGHSGGLYGRLVEGHTPSPHGFPVLRWIFLYRHVVVITPVARLFPSPAVRFIDKLIASLFPSPRDESSLRRSSTRAGTDEFPTLASVFGQLLN